RRRQGPRRPTRLAAVDRVTDNDVTMARIGRGIDLGWRGEREAARLVLAAVWRDIGGDDGDPLYRCGAAHALADLQDDVREELIWDLRALAAADSLTDARAALAGVAVPVSDFYPSLHLNLGECYRKLGEFGHARQQLQLGREASRDLAAGEYAEFVSGGLDRLAEQIGAAEDPARPRNARPGPAAEASPPARPHPVRR
ncbi:MAG: hypothetical protein QOC77_415, partial [Thermoleophilaceae bacterium]|nr:hypothetical protein [Thermoleophilaceae bacterium]